MPYEKLPSSGAFLPLSLMYFLSGEPMHDLSGVDRQQAKAQDLHGATRWKFIAKCVIRETD